MQFHFHGNQNHFHKNGFAIRLALKQTHKRTRKWPIHRIAKMRALPSFKKQNKTETECKSLSQILLRSTLRRSIAQIGIKNMITDLGCRNIVILVLAPFM